MHYFICARCNHITKQKIEMRRHLNKINICKIKNLNNTLSKDELDNKSLERIDKLSDKNFNKKNELDCKNCNKHFSNKSNLKKHIKNVCFNKINETNELDNKIIIESNNENYNEHNNEKLNKKINEKIKEEINEHNNERINEQINEKIKEEINEQINAKINQQFSERINEQIKEEINEKLNQQLRERINKQCNQQLNNKSNEDKSSEKNIDLQSSTNYIYLLQEREFIKTKEDVYKIGMTKKENYKRFNQYPKGSVLLFQFICNNCNDIEKKIINIFIESFKQRKDIGTEYFEGDYNNMIDIIYFIIKDENKKIYIHNEIKYTEDKNENIINNKDNEIKFEYAY